MSLFKPKQFNKPKDRPFFFTSFVSTMDGKIFVDKEGYWPIGSQTDYKFFTFLRAHADAIVDGKNTALKFGSKTIDSIHGNLFKDYQKHVGKKGLPEYIVVTSRPDDELSHSLQNTYQYRSTVLTISDGNDRSRPITTESVFNIKPVSPGKHVEISDLVNYLNQQGHEYVFIDGGPTVLAMMIEQNLIDELFLTIAPKIFGSEQGKSLTMVEGKLFSPDQVKQFELVEAENEGNEVYLRYKK